MRSVMAQGLWQVEVDALQAVTTNLGNTIAVTMTNPANQFSGMFTNCTYYGNGGNLTNSAGNSFLDTTATNGLATTNYVNAITNGLVYLNMTIVPWDGTVGTHTVSMAGNNIYWYSNNVSVSQTILVSNVVAGGWVDIEGKSSGAQTVTLNTYAASTNWLTAVWTAWGSGKFDRLGIDCISTSPSTNLTLGFKEGP